MGDAQRVYGEPRTVLHGLLFRHVLTRRPAGTTDKVREQVSREILQHRRHTDATARGKPGRGPEAERQPHAEYSIPVTASGLAGFDSLPGPLAVGTMPAIDDPADPRIATRRPRAWLGRRAGLFDEGRQAELTAKSRKDRKCELPTPINCIVEWC